MNILQVHNFYQKPGGEDHVFATERRLMERKGDSVRCFTVHNDQINLNCSLSLAKSAIWNTSSYRRLRKLFQYEHTDIVHFHNTFPIISPSAYYAAKIEGVAVVQTLHNYRLICPTGAFFRRGRVCEKCLDKSFPWPGFFQACYRASYSATFVTSLMLSLHRAIHTYRRMVDVYISLTEFSRKKFIAGGLPAQNIMVKPNFVDFDPGFKDKSADYALFIGRLSPEKGIKTLLKAWHWSKPIPLKVIGDGPLMGELKKIVQSQKLRYVELMGHKLYEEVITLMKGARFLIFPSEWFETFGRVAIEAFACGVPVIATRLGAMAEIVEDGRTGMHFNPGDPVDLATKVEWAWANSSEMEEMGRNARREYEEKYTAERNYKMLMEIYRIAIERSKEKGKQ